MGLQKGILLEATRCEFASFSCFPELSGFHHRAGLKSISPIEVFTAGTVAFTQQRKPRFSC